MNLTNRCNTYCRYCFQSAQVNDTDYLNIENVSEILKYVMTKASDGQKRILHLTGGEPTMNSDFCSREWIYCENSIKWTIMEFI